jgi:SNF2 family DNA or RNA helicase
MHDNSSSISISGDHLVLDFPYDREQVAAIKRVPGAKWDKVSKVWRAPMTSLEEIRQFGIDNNMHVDEEILLFNVWKSKNEASGLYEDGAWIYLSFRYDPVKVRSVKSLPGVTWHAKTMAWRVPVSAIQEAIKWADRFNEKVPENLRAKSKAIHDEQQLRTEGSRSVDADINIEGLNGELLPYQRAGISYASQARRCFIADDMGLGKTIQAICTVEYVYDSYPVVVVCPPSLVLNWAVEWNKWFAGRNVKTVTDRKNFPDSGTYDVVVVGYSNIGHWQKELSNHRSYIFDESHYCKNPTAQRTKAAVKIANSSPKEGLVLCLTGTPVTNRPNEYASQLDILGRLKDFGGLWGFYRRYCGAFRDRFGQWHIDGATNLEELNNMLRATCYIRRTKEQVLKELPEVRHSPIYIEIDAKSMAEYKKAKDDIVKYVMERAKEIAKELGEPIGSAAVRAKIKAESNEHLVRMSVLRKIAAKGKIKAVAEIVDSLIESGEKVVVAAHHRDVVDELAGRYGNMKIQGGMKVEAVEDVKKRFQEESVEEAPVIVLSIQAAKTGHTLTAASNVVFVELPWTPADVDQTYSRCHRLGQKNAVSSVYLLAKGTIDEEIFSLINQKRDVINAAIEGISQENIEENIAQTLILSLFDSAINP